MCPHTVSLSRAMPHFWLPQMRRGAVRWGQREQVWLKQFAGKLNLCFRAAENAKTEPFPQKVCPEIWPVLKAIQNSNFFSRLWLLPVLYITQFLGSHWSPAGQEHPLWYSRRWGNFAILFIGKQIYVHSVIITIFSLKREGRCIWNKLQGISHTHHWKALQWEAKWIDDISDKSNSCIRKYGSRSNTRGICKNEFFFSVLQANRRQKSPAV